MGLTVMENAEEDEDISVKGPVFLKKKTPKISNNLFIEKLKDTESFNFLIFFLQCV
jgi:hypothetical protein